MHAVAVLSARRAECFADEGTTGLHDPSPSLIACAAGTIHTHAMHAAHCSTLLHTAHCTARLHIAHAVHIVVSWLHLLYCYLCVHHHST